MASEIATLEAEVKEYKLQLDTVASGLLADPDSAELQELKAELEQVISLTEASIAELRPAAVAPAADDRKKWSRDTSHATGPADEEPGALFSSGVFQVNDTVLAKWYSGDKGFYPARITAITGSSTAPWYTVKFKNYDTVETLRAKDLRTLSNGSSTKRKADGTPVSTAASSTPSKPASSSVISAAAHINPELAQASRREHSKVSDGPPRSEKAAKKARANRELESSKNKWQDFAAKGKFARGTKKESMFRTPEGINGRVGFTGSGQAMRKDATRSRHIYQPGGEEDM